MPQQPRDRTKVIDNALAFVRLPADVAAGLAADLAVSLRMGQGDGPTPETVSAKAETAFLPTIAVSAEAAMESYFGVMQQFLTMQGNVMEAALGGGGAAEPADDIADWQPPLLHRVSLSDAGHLTAETDFDPLADPFIAQHVLYAPQVSDRDATLQALPVLPLAVSLEMVAEAAAVLTGQVATRLENVRARDWIAFDDGPATLTTQAEISAQDMDETRVTVRILRGTTLVFEAEAVFAEPGAIDALPPLTAPIPPRWQDADLYTTGMFHGPLFQGVRHLRQWDAGGLDAELADLPLDGFFAGGQEGGQGPEGLLLNPALLDQIGHVTAFWIAQGAGTDFSSFPSSIDRIDLCAPRTEAVAGAVLSGRIGFRDAADIPVAGPEQARFLQGDFLCTAPDGMVLMRAMGWRDRFFRVPHAFYDARYRPRDAWYGAALPDLFKAQPQGVLVWSVPAFPPGFLEDAGGIWMRVLAATVLSATERTTWRSLTGPAKRRRDWLMGRIALKEAARAWILQQHGLTLLPADVPFAVTGAGKPYLDGAALAALGLTGPLPEVSLAHAQGAALAVAAPQGQAVGIDMEYTGTISADLLAEGAFSSTEHGVLDMTAPDLADRLLTGWCAKEAVAKALGEGLTGRPRAFVLTMLNGDAARVVTPAGQSMDVALARHGNAVMALVRVEV